MKALFFAATMTSLLVASCAKQQEPASDAGPTATVRVQPISAKAIRTTLDAYGTVGFPPEYLHSVDASAEVRVERVLVSSGESVRRGQTLMVVRPTANSSLELAKARADLQFSSQQLARLTALRRQELATNTELAAGRLAQDTARAVLGNIESRLGNQNGEILAAREGFVAVVDAQQGDIVAAGASLLHLADRANLRLRLGVEPSDLSRVKENQPVRVSAIYDSKITAAGRVIKLVRQVDPQTRLAEALVDIDAASGLLPGSTVKATIELTSIPHALTVPRSAVLYSGERAYVFVVKGNKAYQAWVELGLVSGDELQVLSGVKQADAVVVEGNYELQDGMAVKLAAAAQ